MTDHNLPIAFKDLKEGSIYCFLSPFQYLRLSTNSKVKYLNEIHSREKLSYDPLSTLKYEPDKFQVMQIKEFRQLVELFYEELNAKLLAAIPPPVFLLEKQKWFNQLTFYCYFSETHRISVCPIYIPAVCETDDGYEEATQINRNLFESQGNEHLIKQFQLHLKTCQTISKPDFISAFQSYFTVIYDRIERDVEMSFPDLKRKLPDDDY